MGKNLGLKELVLGAFISSGIGCGSEIVNPNTMNPMPVDNTPVSVDAGFSNNVNPDSGSNPYVPDAGFPVTQMDAGNVNPIDAGRTNRAPMVSFDNPYGRGPFQIRAGRNTEVKATPFDPDGDSVQCSFSVMNGSGSEMYNTGMGNCTSTVMIPTMGDYTIVVRGRDSNGTLSGLEYQDAKVVQNAQPIAVLDCDRRNVDGICTYTVPVGEAVCFNLGNSYDPDTSNVTNKGISEYIVSFSGNINDPNALRSTRRAEVCGGSDIRRTYQGKTAVKDGERSTSDGLDFIVEFN